MKIKIIIFYIKQALIDIPCLLIHECSHWIFSFLTFCIGLNTFPKIEIIRWPTIDIKESGNVNINSIHGYVTMMQPNRFEIHTVISTFMPVITTILLFIFSPYFMWIYYIAGIETLWLSGGDINYINKYFELRKRRRQINKTIKL